MFSVGLSLLFIVFALFVVFGIAQLYEAWKERQIRRFIEDTPTSSPRAVALGLAEITGTAQEASQTLSAPLESGASLLYEYVVYEYDDTGDSDDYGWEGIATGTLGVPFMIEGQEGRVLVDPKDARILDFESSTTSSAPDQLPLDGVIWSDSEDPPAPVETFLSRSKEFSKYRIDSDREEDEEDDDTLLDRVRQENASRFGFATRRIEPGDEIYLLGEAKGPDADSIPEDVSAIFEAPEAPQSTFSRLSGSIPLLISTKGEDPIIRDKKRSERGLILGGLLFVIVGILFIANMLEKANII